MVHTHLHSGPQAVGCPTQHFRVTKPLPNPCCAAHTRVQSRSVRTCANLSAKDASAPLSGGLCGSRRALLFGVPALLCSLSHDLPALAAPRLRSQGWQEPAELTVLNDLDVPVKVYWVNYDGDAEFYGAMEPRSAWTVQTYKGHAWRFVDGVSGNPLQEHVTSAGGTQVLRVSSGLQMASNDTSSSTTSPQQQLQEGPQPVAEVADAPATAVPEPDALMESFDGFDGLGADEEDYTLARLSEVSVGPGGGSVLLALSGYDFPLEVGLIGNDAANLAGSAMQHEQRRPSMLSTWCRSLMAAGADVQRVMITRMVEETYYARIVLKGPAGQFSSIDARPGDSLSLAMQMRTPIYVSRDVARVHQGVFAVLQRRERMLSEADSGEAERAADAKTRDEIESITRRIPSAPRPVKSLSFDRALQA